METFIQSRLEELRSPQETKNLIGELPPGLRTIEAECVSCCVANLSDTLRSFRSSWLVWQQTGPSKVISSPASWRIVGELGMAAPGEGNPPTSSRDGAGRAWSTAVCEAISRIEQKEVEAPEAVGLPPSLDLHYEEGFLKKQRHFIPPVFSDPLFIPKMAKAVFRVVKPQWCRRHFLRP